MIYKVRYVRVSSGGSMIFALSCFGSPYPPPPGVKISKISWKRYHKAKVPYLKRTLNNTFSDTLTPASTSKHVFPPIFTRRPLNFWSILSPRLPGLPPSNPYGSKVLLSLNIDNCKFLLNCKQRTHPSPPLYLPSPPDPLRIAKRLRITGYLEEIKDYKYEVVITS